MVWSYSGDPANSDRDAVRFYLGDTDSSDQKLQDEEVDFLLTQVSTSLEAAAKGAHALASKYASMVDSRFESVENKNSQRAESYRKLAQQLERQVRQAGGLGIPVAGGIRQSDVDTARSDTDRVPPAFWRGQFAADSSSEDDT